MNELIAVLVGVICGVGASIPVSLGLLVLLSRLPGLAAPTHAAGASTFTILEIPPTYRPEVLHG